MDWKVGDKVAFRTISTKKLHFGVIKYFKKTKKGDEEAVILCLGNERSSVKIANIMRQTPELIEEMIQSEQKTTKKMEEGMKSKHEEMRREEVWKHNNVEEEDVWLKK